MTEITEYICNDCCRSIDINDHGRKINSKDHNDLKTELKVSIVLCYPEGCHYCDTCFDKAVLHFCRNVIKDIDNGS